MDDFEFGSTISEGSNRILSYLIVVLVILIIGGCLFFVIYSRGSNNPKSVFYKPNPNDAFSYALGYVDKSLYTRGDTYREGFSCQHDQEWRKVSVKDLGNNRYKAHGAVISGNWACIKDVSYFTLTVYYDKNLKTYLLQGNEKDIQFSNLCVTASTNEFACHDTLWNRNWKAGDPAER